MKKRGIRLGVACAAIFLLLSIGVSASGLSIPQSGHYLRGKNDTHIFIDQSGTPIILSDRTGKGLFDGLSDGDHILVVFSEAAETYPARAGAYLCIRLGSGTADDLPAQTLTQLADLGWISP